MLLSVSLGKGALGKELVVCRNVRMQVGVVEALLGEEEGEAPLE